MWVFGRFAPAHCLGRLNGNSPAKGFRDSSRSDPLRCDEDGEEDPRRGRGEDGLGDRRSSEARAKVQKIGAPDAREASGLTSTSVTTRDVRPYALKCTEDVGADMREIQKAAVHASLTTTEGYLEQHRDRLVEVRLLIPRFRREQSS